MGKIGFTKRERGLRSGSYLEHYTSLAWYNGTGLPMGHICESYRIMGSSEKPCKSYRPSLYKVCKQQRGQCVDILGAS